MGSLSPLKKFVAGVVAFVLVENVAAVKQLVGPVLLQR